MVNFIFFTFLFYFIGQKDWSVFTPTLAKNTHKQNSHIISSENLLLSLYLFQWCKTCPRLLNTLRGLSMKSPPHSFCYLSFLCNTFSTLDVTLAIIDLVLYFIFPVNINIWNLYSQVSSKKKLDNLKFHPIKPMSPPLPLMKVLVITNEHRMNYGNFMAVFQVEANVYLAFVLTIRPLTSWHRLHSSKYGDQSQSDQEVLHFLAGRCLSESSKNSLR